MLALASFSFSSNFNKMNKDFYREHGTIYTNSANYPAVVLTDSNYRVLGFMVEEIGYTINIKGLFQKIIQQVNIVFMKI